MKPDSNAHFHKPSCSSDGTFFIKKPVYIGENGKENKVLKEINLEKYVNLLTTRFLEDPGVMIQINDLKRADFLLSLQFAGQIQAFSKHNAVQLLDDGQGLLIGYSSNTLGFS